MRNCRKTTNRLRAIETNGKPARLELDAQRRKTTNRLRAIETRRNAEFPQLAGCVARPLIAFGRLKLACPRGRVGLARLGRKTTNRLRAIETPNENGGDRDHERKSQDH